MASSAVVIMGRPNDDPLGPTGTVGVCAERHNKFVVLVDAGDPWNGSEILERLEYFNVRNLVTHVVITHGHLDHCANMGLFPNAKHILDTDVGMRRKGKKTCEYSVISQWPYKVSDNIELMKLSGHTASDTVVICREWNRTVVFAGDLVEDVQEFHTFKDAQMQLVDGFDNPEDEELFVSQEFVFSSGDFIMTYDDEARSSGSLQSSCPICLLELRLRDKVSALNCGHVFHFGCVNQWLAAKKQCPSCRKVVPRSGFIEKLYFNVVKDDSIASGLPQIDYKEETSRLMAALAAEQEKQKVIEAENKKLIFINKSLEKKILKEKDRTKYEIPRLEAIVDNLKIMADEVPQLQREIAETRNKLKATEFYNILKSTHQDADKQLYEYLKKNGSLSTEKFFELIKSQNKDLNETRRQLRKEIEKLTDNNNLLQRTVVQKNKIIRTLKENILDLRDRANVKTPMNKRLQKVIDDLPAKRVSMGFDETNLLENESVEDITLTLQKENSIPTFSKLPLCDLNEFSFDSDEEEYFTLPKKGQTEKKEKVNAIEDSFNFSFDIPVPNTIVKRIPVKNISDPSRMSSSELSINTISSDSTIETVCLKRKLSQETKSTRSVKPAKIKSARLSSFYKRIPSASSSMNTKHDTAPIVLD